VTSDPSQLPTYPIISNDDISLDPRYLELQKDLPFKAQMPHGVPIWIVTRYTDAKFVYGDRKFGKAPGIGVDTPRMHGMDIGTDPSRLDNMDPPNHTRVRRLASAAFTPQKIRDMTGWIQGISDELLDDVERGGKGSDLMELFCWKLPLRVVAAVLGAADEQIPELKHHVDLMTGVTSTMDERVGAYMALSGIVSQLIDERRTAPKDDLLSILVQARENDDRLSEQELLNIGITLFLGGFETTAAQLGSTVWTLMSNRDRWVELRDERDLMDAALEELWRWIPSFRHGSPMIRWAFEDVELPSGQVIPANEPVLAEHQVANRDERAFPNAQVIDFHRSDPNPHLALAWGSHRCMGAHLANLEVEIALTSLLDRFPNLELAVAPEDVKWSPSTFLRSCSELPITW
jgi:cytochrome P450 RapN